MRPSLPIHFAALLITVVFAHAGEPIASVAAAKPELREMNTDRPDQTESPFTVDAGHFQIEAGLASWTRHAEGSETWTAGGFNAKVGLLDNADLQVVWDSYIQHDDGLRRIEGSGDLTLRLKYNLWGNDGGNTALALMPFVTMPTAHSGLGVADTEGGLIVPLSLTLAKNMSLGLMAEWDYVSLEDGGYGHEMLFTATLGRSLTERLGAFVELAATVPLDPGGPTAWQADVGFGYALTDTLVLDAGGFFGLNDAADDVTLFAGISWKW